MQHNDEIKLEQVVNTDVSSHPNTIKLGDT